MNFQIEKDSNMVELATSFSIVDHEFIDVMQMEILEGRNFDRTQTSDLTKAFVVNETAAKAFGWGKNAPGKRIKFGINPATGVAQRDGKHPGNNNRSGFSGLPGGIRSNIKSQLTFHTFGQCGYWWTSNENWSTTAWSQGLLSYKVGLTHTDFIKGYGLSVRCVKD